ncbi:hypothetical protein H8M03_05235 [Sphingomonas sabuli]|uniref:Uncharacterized protein n=1 Tax=Sphingomonas sabuli TaxID=2764186 RepID=A0A7G9L528_9SPHN|nr:hypothetical protein [Sphingomonas sabuli]QNM83727.1 hypothetical protein H8M03_05235 [Sphingomonas sabuli]
MTRMVTILFLGLAVASPALAQAPQAPPGALYCLKMEPITGTRIGSIMCQTREQWYADEIDLDAVWAEDGVKIIG